MDAGRRTLLLKGLGILALALVSSAAFSAYLRPDMLVNFANLVLCY
jgi:hypothetical protein